MGVLQVTRLWDLAVSYRRGVNRRPKGGSGHKETPGQYGRGFMAWVRSAGRGDAAHPHRVDNVRQEKARTVELFEAGEDVPGGVDFHTEE